MPHEVDDYEEECDCVDVEEEVEGGRVDGGPDAEAKRKIKAILEGDMRAELKFLDKKWSEQGRPYHVETVNDDIPEQVDWQEQFALCVIQHMDRSNKYVQSVSLQVNSKHLKDILKDVIGDYPGISFRTKDISITKPYHVLYHYHKELEAAGEAMPVGSEAARHLNLLLDFIKEEFSETITECDNLNNQGLTSYPLLWTTFRPGCTVYALVFGQPRAFILEKSQYLCDPPGLQLSLRFVDFDGTDFGTRQTSRFVPAFAGTERIRELTAYPLEWHQDPAAAKKRLLERGREFEKLAGMHFCNYRGIALENGGCGVGRYNCDGRVVVDTKTFHRLNANSSWNITAFKVGENEAPSRRKIAAKDGVPVDLIPQNGALDPLTDEQCLLSNAMVRGFSFTEKKWFDFFVKDLSSPGWDRDCFEKLVLPPAQKDLVRALVATHVQQRLGFDDIVKGKGKGLIMVLHGSPGIGKTLTAEMVAEFCERPLYMVSSGDLGTDAETLDERLSKILDMASTWKAVLLIDEADVFLERRSLHDLHRNALVSIFLRVLEYYEGILFLTSNRVDTFDDAFKSRIHVPLKYNDLTVQSRKQIWKNFIAKMEGDNVAPMDEEDYGALSTAVVNGRQIKNIIRTAKSLAQFHGQKLDRAMLEQVVQIQEAFEQDLVEKNGTPDVDGRH
ncbi:hypothetical protein BAUCODRAFT_69134 [Baudoinia panamericana UAMH 10762]|uniref:AAA+ ATPase domain-containing protein n=1 Tax=Baudoinia panamericana (strain UAMH 10762) TaxID=717646 RepID=M2NF90_BAUPA|nr:uncharacterized protein BAUCODRAFT_69134 [Baudoinia panamericana UAMH 10762]EMC97645.1 hypothetical protein BAUCODRAFT_69134 [Baudoinia panamericana UAMH 10762]